MKWLKKIRDNVRNRFKKKRKPEERSEMKKNDLSKTLQSSFQNFSKSENASRKSPPIKISLAKYKFSPQYKKKSFTGYTVKFNVTRGKYVGFINAKIWTRYVPADTQPSAAKVEWMLAVSRAIRAGYQGPIEELPAAPPVPLPPEGNPPETHDGPVPYMRIAK